MRDVLRTVRLSPYRRGMGPTFTLQTWWLGDRVGYELKAGGRVIFTGEDFRPSPLHAIDSDESIGALLGFLTLRPGDTDSEYFDDYTTEQREFCDRYAEALSLEAERRFGSA